MSRYQKKYEHFSSKLMTQKYFKGYVVLIDCHILKGKFNLYVKRIYFVVKYSIRKCLRPQLQAKKMFCKINVTDIVTIYTCLFWIIIMSQKLQVVFNKFKGYKYDNCTTNYNGLCFSQVHVRTAKSKKYGKQG